MATARPLLRSEYGMAVEYGAATPRAALLARTRVSLTGTNWVGVGSGDDNGVVLGVGAA